MCGKETVQSEAATLLIFLHGLGERRPVRANSVNLLHVFLHGMLVFFSLLAGMIQAHMQTRLVLLRCDFDSWPKTTPERNLSRMSDYDETSTSVNLQKAACKKNSITGCSSHCHSFSVFFCTWGQSKAAGMMSSAKSFQYLQAGNCSNQT